MSGLGSPTVEINETIHEYKESPPSSDSDEEVPLNMKKRLFGRTKTVHALVGGGPSANVLLWRNKQISGGIIAGATVVWLVFEWMGYHLITFICHSLIASLLLLFLWSNAASIVNSLGPADECVDENTLRYSWNLISSFFLHPDPLRNFLRCQINRAFTLFRCVASGKDLKKFLKVIAGLWFLSVIGSWFSFLTLLYIVFMSVFSLPVLYEKYEDQVDAAAEKAMIEINKQYAVLDAKVLQKLPQCSGSDKKRC